MTPKCPKCLFETSRRIEGGGCPYCYMRLDLPTIDTMNNSYATGTIIAALNHNAGVVQFASEILAAGPGIKPSKLKQIRAQFDKMHQAYDDEHERIRGILNEELKSRGVEL